MKTLGMLVLAFILLYSSYAYFHNDYMTRSPLTVTVYDKLTLPGRNTADLSIVYKTQAGVYFDRYVSHSTYATSHVGDTYTIMIRPFDVRQTSSQNVIYFFGPIFFLFGAAFYCLFVIWHLAGRNE